MMFSCCEPTLQIVAPIAKASMLLALVKFAGAGKNPIVASTPGWSHTICAVVIGVKASVPPQANPTIVSTSRMRIAPPSASHWIPNKIRHDAGFLHEIALQTHEKTPGTWPGVSISDAQTGYWFGHGPQALITMSKSST